MGADTEISDGRFTDIIAFDRHPPDHLESEAVLQIAFNPLEDIGEAKKRELFARNIEDVHIARGNARNRVI